jgi:hypothetical protein
VGDSEGVNKARLRSKNSYFEVDDSVNSARALDEAAKIVGRIGREEHWIDISDGIFDIGSFFNGKSKKK